MSSSSDKSSESLDSVDTLFEVAVVTLFCDTELELEACFDNLHLDITGVSVEAFSSRQITTLQGVNGGIFLFCTVYLL